MALDIEGFSATHSTFIGKQIATGFRIVLRIECASESSRSLCQVTPGRHQDEREITNRLVQNVLEARLILNRNVHH